MQKHLLKLKSKNLDRSPRLDTILMVEKTFFKYKSDKSITEIWKRLPKKVMWTTFKTILNYLEYSGKIYVEKDKTITWLWNPHKIKELEKKNLVVANKTKKETK
jgi:ribosomal protein L24E